MPIDILDAKAVWNSLSVEDCIPLMRNAAIAHYQQQVILPQRKSLPLFKPTDSLMVMPAAQQREKAIAEDHLLGDIAQVFLAQMAGRVSDKGITVYKSLGNADQDLAAAYRALEHAREKGLANRVEF